MQAEQNDAIHTAWQARFPKRLENAALDCVHRGGHNGGERLNRIQHHDEGGGAERSQHDGIPASEVIGQPAAPEAAEQRYFSVIK
jgi:hypothetical protein